AARRSGARDRPRAAAGARPCRPHDHAPLLPRQHRPGRDLRIPRLGCLRGPPPAASHAYVAHHLPRWGFAFTGLAIGWLLPLALLMPQALAPLTTHPWATLAVVYGAASAVAALLAARARVAVPLLACFANAALSFFIANYALAAFKETNPLRRHQARVVLASFIALVVAGALLVASTFQWVTLSLPIAVYLVPLWICGGLLAYAMLELNLFDLGGVVRRGLTAGILAVGAIGVYLALYLGLRSIVDATTAWAVA